MIVTVVGGDARFKYMAETLSADGANVKKYAVPDCKNETDLSECVKEADVVIFPMPWSKDGILLNSQLKICSEEVVKIMKKDACLLSGGANNNLNGLCSEMGVKLFDYSKCEDFLTENAIITAEAALSEAIQNTKLSIYKSKCLVAGYGRIGKFLVKYLCTLGADVEASTRRNTDYFRILEDGAKPIKTSNIAETIDKCDIIFNTVPHMLFDKDVLKKMKEGVLIIDLASYPYGTDIDEASKLKRNIMISSGLPGKYSEKTAGIIIAKTVKKILSEAGVWK